MESIYLSSLNGIKEFAVSRLSPDDYEIIETTVDKIIADQLSRECMASGNHNFVQEEGLPESYFKDKVECTICGFKTTKNEA